MTHPAWKPRGPEWAQLAPGVRWRLAPVTGDIQAEVSARVQRLISGLQQGRADLDALGFEGQDLGVLADLDILAGVSVFAGAVYTAERVLLAWEGVEDAETGEAVDVDPDTADPDDRKAAIIAALRFGAPDGGSALLGPFMAWVDRPRLPIGADLRRLRELAEWEHGGGLTHCDGCGVVEADCARGGTDGGARCPRFEHAPQTVPGQAALAASRHSGVWGRAGMGGQIIGLDFNQCLDLGRAAGVQDEAAFIRCLAAIEVGATAAAMKKAEGSS